MKSSHARIDVLLWNWHPRRFATAGSLHDGRPRDVLSWDASLVGPPRFRLTPYKVVEVRGFLLIPSVQDEGGSGESIVGVICGSQAPE